MSERENKIRRESWYLDYFNRGKDYCYCYCYNFKLLLTKKFNFLKKFKITFNI